MDTKELREELLTRLYDEGYSYITEMENKELRQEILQRLYDNGFKYIAKDFDANIYAYEEKPKKEEVCWFSVGHVSSLYIFKDLFRDIRFEDSEPLKIANELNIIDWAKVPKDTKVLVSDDGKEWYKRYFKEYTGDEECPFSVYFNGRTSWNYEGDNSYKYCKLAEELRKTQKS